MRVQLVEAASKKSEGWEELNEQYLATLHKSKEQVKFITE